MVKNNVQVKEKLSVTDKINMTKGLVAGYFIDGEYTPYYSEINDIVAFFTYCVDGIEFSEDESIYASVVEDKELMAMYTGSGIPDLRPYKLREQLDEIYTIVKDMVEFEKQRIIHSSTPIDEKVLEILEKESRNKDAELKLIKDTERLQKEQVKQLEYVNKISSMMTPEETVELNRLMLKNGEYDPNEMAKVVADRYFESGKHDENLESVIQAKNDKIRELEVYKQEHDARNVLVDNLVKK